MRAAVLAGAAALAIASASQRTQATLLAGIAKVDITPPIGTPLAGFEERAGRPSIGVHDPTEARALVIDNGRERVAFVSVDHLGFDHGMVERIRSTVSTATTIKRDHIFVMSSHTHAGGGAYAEPASPLAFALAGTFDQAVRAGYERKTAEAIVAASRSLTPARIGFGSGEARDISRFRASWPADGTVDPEVGVIRVDSALSGKPIAVLMNFAAHPTVIDGKNFLFSADYVGYARQALEQLIGGGVMALFANGAQGTTSPRTAEGADGWERAKSMGTILATEVSRVVQTIRLKGSVDVMLVRSPLTLKVVPTRKFTPNPSYPESYASEIDAVSFDDRFALVTIPGELSDALGRAVKEHGHALGFETTLLLGLTNDAAGYIISEDEYRHETYESGYSFFGPAFGSFIANQAFQLLKDLRAAAAPPIK